MTGTGGAGVDAGGTGNGNGSESGNDSDSESENDSENDIGPGAAAHVAGPGRMRLVRRSTHALAIGGMVGVLAELFLLGHTEGTRQLLPIGALGLGVVVTTLAFARPGFLTVGLQRLAMLACVGAGGAGLWFHYSGNAEFELEMAPTIEGFDLVREAMTGATPVLAPGAMLLLGGLGLIASLVPRVRSGSE